uniref:Alpha(B)-crystallin protein n=1 Tax=Rattus norvegicus TaxID=10116 RepID=Q63138_RAT|nr:ORF32 [Rattus norvegicus]
MNCRGAGIIKPLTSPFQKLHKTAYIRGRL